MTSVESELSILIADDHPAIVQAITQALDGLECTIVGVAVDGDDAEAQIRAKKPQVAILDLRMPQKTGLEVARAVSLAVPETAIVIYTGFADQTILAEAMRLEVKGFVSKSSPVDDLTRAVQAAATGDVFIDPLIGGVAVATPNSSARKLTQRELEVLRRLAEGLTNDEIGKSLFLSPETIRTHVRKACKKLNAQNRVEAVANALRLGLIA